MRKLITLGLATTLVFSSVTANAAGYTPKAQEQEFVDTVYHASRGELVKDHYGNKNTSITSYNDAKTIRTISDAIDITPKGNISIQSDSWGEKDVSIYLKGNVKTVKRVKLKLNDGSYAPYGYSVSVKRFKKSKLVSRVILKSKGNKGFDKFNCYDARGKKIGSFMYVQNDISKQVDE